MALNYDVKNNKNAFREISEQEYKNEKDKKAFIQCPSYEENGKYYEMNTECNILIMLLGLVVGISELNESNYKKVYNRIDILEKINGAYMTSYNPKKKVAEPYFFTEEIIKNNIGIKTNGIELNRRAFEKKVLNQLFEGKEI